MDIQAHTPAHELRASLVGAQGAGIDFTADAALVASVLQRVPSAVQAFVERMRCIPRILAAKNRRMGGALSPEDLADLAQEVFSALWRKVSSYSAKASLEAWAGQFCLFTYMNAYRSRRNRPSHVHFDQTHHDLEDAEDVKTHGTKVVRDALKQLDRHVARIIQMHDFENKAFANIAREIDMPLGTVKTLYYRGLDKLREVLRTQYGVTDQ